MVSREFCEISARLQTFIHQRSEIVKFSFYSSQERRMDLERDLFLMMQSKEEEKLPSSALPSSNLLLYYQQLCEQEDASHRRNEQLQGVIQQISAYIDQIHERSAKIRSLKMEYDAYIDDCYPTWRETVLQATGVASAQSSAQRTPLDEPIQAQVKRQVSKPATPVSRLSSSTPPMGLDSRNRTIENSPTHSPRSLSPIFKSRKKSSTPVTKKSTPSGMLSPRSLSPPMATDHRSRTSPSSSRVLTPSILNSDVSSGDESEEEEDKAPQMQVVTQMKATASSTKEESESPKAQRPVSLPLNKSTPAVKTNSSTPPTKTTLQSISNMTKARLTLPGLYRLLHYIEEQLADSGGNDQMYRASVPSKSIFEEIVNSANNLSSSLAHLNSVSVSMLVVHELASTFQYHLPPDNCLFSDDFIHKALTNSVYLNVNFLNDNLSAEQLDVWKRLRSHFTHLQKRRCMGPREIASSFASHLIHEDSTMDEEMEALLEGLLTSMPVQSLETGRSQLTNTDESASFASVTPRISSREPVKTKLNPLSQSLMATAGSFQEDLRSTINPDHQASEEALLYAQKMSTQDESDSSSEEESSPTYQPSEKSTPEHKQLQRTESEVYRDFIAKQLPAFSQQTKASPESDEMSKVEDLMTPNRLISGVPLNAAEKKTTLHAPKMDPMSTAELGSSTSALRSTQSLLRSVRDNSDYEDSENEDPLRRERNGTLTSTGKSPTMDHNNEEDFYDFYN